MEDKSNEPKKTDDIKKIEETTDFEMGKDDDDMAPAPQGVKINNYTKDIKAPTPVPEQSKVNPMAPAPTPVAPAPRAFQESAYVPRAPQESASVQPIRNAASQVTIGQARMGIPNNNITVKKPETNPAARKKALFGCLGILGSIMLIFLVLAFFFISQGGGDTTNPITTLLGINQASFINGLITLVHIIFIIASLIAFVFTMVGLFKASMAKREDKETKRAGLRSSLVSGIILVIILLTWMFIYVYLDGKRIQIGPEIKQPIVTTPVETLNLTAPIEIKFDASNVPLDKNKFQIISYEWDFGDGKTGTSQIVSHNYTEKGRYDVLLNITKKDKKTAEEAKDQYSVVVSIGKQALTASFTATPQSGEAPLKVDFDASASTDPDGTISRYEWDFNKDGDYTDAEGAKVTHTFDKIGKYKVSLRVTSTIGDYNIGEKEIIVEEQKEPQAVITVVEEPATYVTNLNYVFNADSSTSPNGKIEKYEWDFGDGSKVGTTKTVSHIFATAGTYEITLKVTDEKTKEGEVKKVIKVEAPQGMPKAKIKTQPALEKDALDLVGRAPFQVVFDASESSDSDNNIVDYKWDFDSDGKNDQFGKSVTYTFEKEGTYTTTLSVVDADENIGTATLVVKVEPKGITAVLTADKVEGNVPLTVKFDATGSVYNKGQITSYRWDFGDGTAPKLSDASITHKYTSIGTYTAKVTVIGSDNSTSTAEVLITIREIPLSACFVSVFENGPAPLETTFDPGCSTGTISSYFWDFGDGKTSTEVKPTHIFEAPGEYTATLEIADSQNTISKAELKITVTDAQ